MTWEQLAGAIGFFITVSGALWVIWWRIEGKVEAVRAEAQRAADAAAALAIQAKDETAAHRLYVAQTYITKEGLRDVRDEIMSAMHDIKGAIETVGGRIDGMYQTGSTPRQRAVK
ncbi:hypothetical protein [Mesorhizobium sp. M1322]|uniref:hypothetical protein n=1 Tax=Mesorhizobium sp. M1322 TaxID=2957081 RepID=UPI003335B988